MNNTLRELKNRKSVRGYEPRPVEPAHKTAILEAALQAPSAGNMCLYTILDITDESLKQRLSITCDDQPFIATAPLVLVFCADYKRWYDVFCAHNEQVRLPDAGDFLLAAADAFIAAQNAVVAAESLGIGSCYIGDITENYEVHKELLSLPKYVAPICMVCFGYPTEVQKKRVKPPRFKVEDVVCQNGYSSACAERMGEMLAERQGLTAEEFPDWVQKFCARKWNSAFSVEMSRSVRAMLEDWCKDS